MEQSIYPSHGNIIDYSNFDEKSALVLIKPVVENKTNNISDEKKTIIKKKD